MKKKSKLKKKQIKKKGKKTIKSLRRFEPGENGIARNRLKQ